ncbi:hypothetical protein B0T10DRAFT_568021 [Thelonectria olida]|uniref:Uncharacterized protein n=1 Tax=Thelonectria olida TaxID=1576542 RepID=A0A9P8VR91_9HYPO|nr:hypothetical protein B0T10DRAFT_568021 [Thelonectria olida]
MRTEVGVTQSSPRSPPGSTLFLPPVEYDWDENTPILSRPSSPKDLRPEASSETSPKAATPARRPTTTSQETRLKLTTRGRGPTGASLKSGTKISSLENRPTATSETSPKTSPRQRPVYIVSKANRFATHLLMPGSEPRPVFTKKSAPNLRMSAKPEPLELPPLPASSAPSTS